jgi:uncharacterized membrane protein YgdD (TMEM256/DUF423 family)
MEPAHETAKLDEVRPGEATSGRRFFRIGAILGGLGVAAGAFGAHGLRTLVSAEDLVIFETGVRYHLIHALAILAAAWAAGRFPGRAAAVAGWLFVAGIVVFSGTLYAMTLGAPRWLGAVTPLGGVSLIAGWACLAVSAGGRIRERRGD